MWFLLPHLYINRSWTPVKSSLPVFPKYSLQFLQYRPSAGAHLPPRLELSLNPEGFQSQLGKNFQIFALFLCDFVLFSILWPNQILAFLQLWPFILSCLSKCYSLHLILPPHLIGLRSAIAFLHLPGYRGTQCFAYIATVSSVILPCTCLYVSPSRLIRQYWLGFSLSSWNFIHIFWIIKRFIRAYGYVYFFTRPYHFLEWWDYTTCTAIALHGAWCTLGAHGEMLMEKWMLFPYLNLRAKKWKHYLPTQGRKTLSTLPILKTYHPWSWKLLHATACAKKDVDVGLRKGEGSA